MGKFHQQPVAKIKYYKTFPIITIYFIYRWCIYTVWKLFRLKRFTYASRFDYSALLTLLLCITYACYIFEGYQLYNFIKHARLQQHLNKTGKYINYAFPTGSVYGFGIKRRRTPTISETNIKILHTVNKAGLFHILFWLIKF